MEPLETSSPFRHMEYPPGRVQFGLNSTFATRDELRSAATAKAAEDGTKLRVLISQPSRVDRARVYLGCVANGIRAGQSQCSYRMHATESHNKWQVTKACYEHTHPLSAEQEQVRAQNQIPRLAIGDEFASRESFVQAVKTRAAADLISMRIFVDLGKLSRRARFAMSCSHNSRTNARKQQRCPYSFVAIEYEGVGWRVTQCHFEHKHDHLEDPSGDVKKGRAAIMPILAKKRKWSEDEQVSNHGEYVSSDESRLGDEWDHPFAFATHASYQEDGHRDSVKLPDRPHTAPYPTYSHPQYSHSLSLPLPATAWSPTFGPQPFSNQVQQQQQAMQSSSYPQSLQQFPYVDMRVSMSFGSPNGNSPNVNTPLAVRTPQSQSHTPAGTPLLSASPLPLNDSQAQQQINDQQQSDSNSLIENTYPLPLRASSNYVQQTTSTQPSLPAPAAVYSDAAATSAQGPSFGWLGTPMPASYMPLQRPRSFRTYPAAFVEAGDNASRQRPLTLYEMLN